MVPTTHQKRASLSAASKLNIASLTHILGSEQLPAPSNSCLPPLSFQLRVQTACALQQLLVAMVRDVTWQFAPIDSYARMLREASLAFGVYETVEKGLACHGEGLQ